VLNDSHHCAEQEENWKATAWHDAKGLNQHLQHVAHGSSCHHGCYSTVSACWTTCSPLHESMCTH
jgi:hypothetical protein